MLRPLPLVRMIGITLIVVWTSLASIGPLTAQDRETKVRADRANLENDDHWIYNDLPAALAEARRTGKPLLVVVRCIPCEACSEFDEEVVQRDERIRKQLDQFVCVRLVQANGLDLSLFHYDFDQSFAAVLMNADRVIYGRFGTRSENRDESQDMTIEGFGQALDRALAWHAQFPANRDRFAAKSPAEPLVAVPEAFPSLKGKYTHELDYAGKVVQSCLHCHQVHEAQRHWYRDRGETIPETVLFPFPSPRVVGLQMDSQQAATIKQVEPGSVAQRDGFQAGDKLLELDGQPLLSIADIQWVLHRAPASGSLRATVERGGQASELSLTLDPGWRKRSNISWRASTWDLRRMAFGGMRMDDLPDTDRQQLNIPSDAFALRIAHVGQYGEHALAKRAGFQAGDILVACGHLQGRMSESELMVHLLNTQTPGSRLPARVLRNGRAVNLQLPVQ